MNEQLESVVLQMYRAGVRYSEAMREFQKAFILTVLKDQRGNQCKAAERLGIHRNTLRRTIRELEIDIGVNVGPVISCDIAAVRTIAWSS